jgi:hypothetical protein
VSNENPTYRGALEATMATTVENKHNNKAAKCTIRYVLSLHYEKLGSVVHLVHLVLNSHTNRFKSVLVLVHALSKSVL